MGIMVNTLADTADANPGNGSAADANGKTSLRAAIEESNARGKGDVDITFDPAIADKDGKITINLTESLSVSEQLNINGDFGTSHFVKITSNSGFSQIVWTAEAGSLNAMQFEGASTEENEDGGAIHVSIASSLGIYNCLLKNNHADDGGAIFSQGTLTVGESSFINNSGSAISSGGEYLGVWWSSFIITSVAKEAQSVL